MARDKDSGAGIGDSLDTAGTGDSGGGDSGGLAGAASELGIPVVDSGSIGGGGGNPGGGSEQPKRRGRKPGSTNKAKTSDSIKGKNGVSSIETILFSLHLMASKVVPEMELDKDESAALGLAIENVAQHYDITPDPKVMAWVGLIGTCATIYGPRAAAWRLRIGMEKAAQQKPRAEMPKAEVVPIYQGTFDGFNGQGTFDQYAQTPQ